MSEMPAFILAFDGHRRRKFYFDNPTFDINEMAWAGAMQCRFTGHVSRFYSINEHGLLVAKLAENLRLGDPFEALMHDAHEGYLNDISSPVKVQLPDYKALETKIETALRKAYGFPEKKNPLIKDADRVALYIEAYHLMGGPESFDELVVGDDVHKAMGRILAPTYVPNCYSPAQARETFLYEYERLKPKEVKAPA